MKDVALDLGTALFYSVLILLLWPAFLVKLMEKAKEPEQRVSNTVVEITIGISCFMWWIYLGGMRI